MRGVMSPIILSFIALEPPHIPGTPLGSLIPISIILTIMMINMVMEVLKKNSVLDMVYNARIMCVHHEVSSCWHADVLL